jgi:hypothetical protein
MSFEEQNRTAQRLTLGTNSDKAISPHGKRKLQEDTVVLGNNNNMTRN